MSTSFSGRGCGLCCLLLIHDITSLSFLACRHTTAGTEYRGHIATTASGKVCQRWDTTTPHPHPYVNADFPEDGNSITSANNYCRNPKKAQAAPWCFVNDAAASPTWEYCNVPFCGKYILL